VPTSAVYGRVVADIPNAGPGLYWFTQVGLRFSLAALFAMILVEELFVLVPDLRRRWSRRAARAQDGRR
jgi:hypothetical protein